MNGTTRTAIAPGIVAIRVSLCVYAADSIPLRYVDGRTVQLVDLKCTLDRYHSVGIALVFGLDSPPVRWGSTLNGPSRSWRTGSLTPTPEP